MKLKNILSEAMSGLPMMTVISNPFAKAFSVVNEAEDDKYVHIGYGKYKEKGKENDKSAPTFTKDDSGKYVPTSGSDSKPKGDQGGETKPNMFAKDYDSPDLKKDEPKSEPAKDSTGDRAGNPEVNKKVRAKAQKMGITPQKLGKAEYQKKMAQAAVAALTDANFHTEARELIAKLEGKPEWAEDPRKSAPDMSSPEWDEWNKKSVYSSEYYDADDDAEEIGLTASNEASWDGRDALDSIAFDLKMNGFKNFAAKLQSVIKESKSTRLNKLLPENIINEGTRAQIGIIDKNGKILSTYVHYDGYPEHTGKILKQYYNPNKMKQLLKIDKGAGISSLDKQISGGKGHSFSNRVDGQTVFYGRDRGESGGKYIKGSIDNIKDYIKDASNQAAADYVYLYNEKDGKLYYAKYSDKDLKTL